MQGLALHPSRGKLPKNRPLARQALRPSAASVRRRQLRQLSLGQFDDSGEVGLFTHGEVGEHLAVDFNTGKLQAIDQTGIGQAVDAGTSVDTLDPQAAESALAELAALLSVMKGTFNSFTSGTVQTAATTAEALGHVQVFLVPTMGSKTSLYTHG